MANTENIEAKLCAYVDGELDAADRAEIEAHLAANPQHQQLLAELMTQRPLLRNLPRARAPEDLLESVHSQLERSVLLDHEEEAAHIVGRIDRRPQIFAAAAIMLLAVGLVAVISFMLPDTTQRSKYAVTAPAGPMTTSTDADTAKSSATMPHVTVAIAENESHIAAKSGNGGGSAGKQAFAGAKGSAADDVFSKGGEAKFSKSSGGTYNNIFANRPADEELDQKLKQTPGVPDDSMLVVVSTDNPSVANQQVQQYLRSNNIRWDALPEATPPPIEFQQGQTISPSRLQNTQIRLKDASQAGQQQQQQSAPVQQQVDSIGQRELAKSADNSGAAGDVAATAAPVATLAAPATTVPSKADAMAATPPINQVAEASTDAIQAQQQTVQTPATQSAFAAQMIVARGLTREQVNGLNSNIAMQNAGKVSNFKRLGGTIAPTTPLAPTTLPAIDANVVAVQTIAPAPAAAERSVGLDGLATETGQLPASAPATQATPATKAVQIPASLQPPGVVMGDKREENEANRAASTQPLAPLASTLPTTSPATQSADASTTQPAAEERVDVVIIVQNDAAIPSTAPIHTEAQTEVPSKAQTESPAPPTSLPAPTTSPTP